MSDLRTYRLKSKTAKKLKEQLYLGLFLGLIIWVLMGFLFVGDNNSQTLILYLAGSAFIFPYIYKNNVKPYMTSLIDNTKAAYFEIDGDELRFNHFKNIKQFGQEKIEFQIADIVNLKKAFRKDDSVNKITLTIKSRQREKIVVEDFENMQDMVDVIIDKLNKQQQQLSGNENT